MKHYIFFVLTISFFFLTACEEDDVSSTPLAEFNFNFSEDAEGWEGEVSDYFQTMEDNIEFSFGHTQLPAPLNETEGALRLASRNVSDDLFMFIKREVTGLTPNARYQFDIEVVFASNVPDNRVGIGGSPGESVYIKAGATTVEPLAMLMDDDSYRMNIDKGNQSQSGDDAIVIGDFSNDTDQTEYTLKTLSTTNEIFAETDSNGTVWVIVGTDSGFEGETVIYYDQINITATRQ